MPTTGGSKVRVGVQRFGTFLSGMIMPNIPALIAWGIFTAFFIEVGWTPNADLATIVAADHHRLHRWQHHLRHPRRRRRLDRRDGCDRRV
jgi:PTS system mannitol-specific IIC component